MSDKRTRVNLRREREKAGHSLEQVSRGARIPLRYIEALETGNIRLVKKGPQLGAFKKQYLQFLGLPENAKLRFRASERTRARRTKSKPSGQTKTITTTSTNPLPRLNFAQVMVSVFVLMMITLLGLKVISSLIDRHITANKVMESLAATQPAPKSPQKSTTDNPPNLLNVLHSAIAVKEAIASSTHRELPSPPPTAPPGLSIRASDHAAAKITVDGISMFEGKMPVRKLMAFDYERKIEIWTNHIGKVDIRQAGSRIRPQGAYNGSRRLVFVRDRSDL